ncbi:MAG: glycosyltransferase family 39 protein, partial [Chloroflexi bacterium]|nr:glycosyltransferase family 39 protein [Chloroflexota bacterium]
MKRTWRSYAIILLVAAFLRGWAVIMLPEDYDESTYLQNGFDYASRIRAGDLDGVIDYFGNYEHPPLVKLVYAGGVLLLGDSASWTHAFYFSRVISAVFGVLAVALMVALDPLAGGMLALHTLAVKYTSQAYLDAIASALILAAILAFLRFNRNDGKRWLWLSAVALGISAASKYTYMPVAIMVIGYLGIFEKKIPWTWLAGYAAVALAIFFVLDVHLWHDPFNRLLQSFSFHLQYSQSAHVQQVAYPWYQPLIWIFTSAPARWHPRVFFYHGFDGAIALLAVAGLRREWKNRRWLVVWLVSGVMFLLLWPTKWPQYALTVTPALCIIGAGTLRRVWNWLRTQEAYWGYVKNYIPAPGKWFWWALGIFLVFVLGIYLSAWGRLAIGRIGWSHMTAQNSDLPSNMVNDILQIDQARILIATDQGAA